MALRFVTTFNSVHMVCPVIRRDNGKPWFDHTRCAARRSASRLAYITNGGRVAVELATWRLGESRPQKLQMPPLDREQCLESMLVEDPSIAGTDLLVIAGTDLLV